MSADTVEIRRARAPRNSARVGFDRWLNKKPVEGPVLAAHPAPRGVEGHWLGDGQEPWWNPFDEEASR